MYPSSQCSLGEVRPPVIIAASRLYGNSVLTSRLNSSIPTFMQTARFTDMNIFNSAEMVSFTEELNMDLDASISKNSSLPDEPFDFSFLENRTLLSESMHQISNPRVNVRSLSDVKKFVKEQSKEFRVLLEDVTERFYPDCILTTTSRGVIVRLFQNTSITPSECIFESIINDVSTEASDLFYSGDEISVLRELRNSEIGIPIFKRCRVKDNECGFKWVELVAQKLEMHTQKKTKCYIMALRIAPNEYKFDIEILNSAISNRALLLKVGSDGIIMKILDTGYIFQEDSKLRLGDQALDYIRKLGGEKSRKDTSLAILEGKKLVAAIVELYPENVSEGGPAPKICFVKPISITESYLFFFDDRKCFDKKGKDIFAPMYEFMPISIDTEISNVKKENEAIRKNLGFARVDK